ncbi:hypothetical protein TH62_06265 [Bacillus sp. TH008]|nr:hypothetical protein TH62_06265 [Bacillus sp. TH008]
MIAISTFITFNSYFLLLFYTIKTLASKGINKKNKKFVDKIHFHWCLCMMYKNTGSSGSGVVVKRQAGKTPFQYNIRNGYSFSSDRLQIDSEH